MSHRDVSRTKGAVVVTNTLTMSLYQSRQEYFGILIIHRGLRAWYIIVVLLKFDCTCTNLQPCTCTYTPVHLCLSLHRLALCLEYNGGIFVVWWASLVDAHRPSLVKRELCWRWGDRRSDSFNSKSTREWWVGRLTCAPVIICSQSSSLLDYCGGLCSV